MSSPDHQATQSAFDQVIAQCTKFSSQWSTDSRPDISVFLEQVEEGAQASLLRNLLDYEIRQRRIAGEHPSVAEYTDKFPGHVSLIRGLFLDECSTPADFETEPPLTVDTVPTASRLGSYRLVRELGRGGMGYVFEAVHAQHGNRVALKTLPQVDGERLHQFKREFRSLSDINHPNLVSLYNLEADGDQWFFTMDIIQGTDFLDYVRPQGVLDEARLRSALTQLVKGMMALHAHQIIHRDLKPTNVMVSDEGHLKLLDFGLVVELDRAGVSMADARIAGTPRYMAPEQARGENMHAAWDWYAVGTMLYEALCGKAPFSGSLAVLLQAKQTTAPLPLEDDFRH